MPRLRILAGPSPSTAIPITANDGIAHEIKGPGFEGRVTVFIRYEDELPAVRSRPQSRASKAGSPSPASSTESIEETPALQYFATPERRGVTWSVQVQGRFVEPVSSDDVLFGNTFDRALKLPWGSGAALKFMNFIDPTLEHDLGGPKPWALSPLVSTMPYLAHTKLPRAEQDPASWPEFPPSPPLVEDCGTLIPDEHRKPSPLPSPSRFFGSRPSSRTASREPSPSSGQPSSPVSPASNERRSIFSTQAARHATTLGPDDLITADFCYGFLSFPSLTLKLPGGISFDCMRYWDRQPVTFMCCRRGVDGKGPGKPFWCVMFEVVGDDKVVDAAAEDDSHLTLGTGGANDVPITIEAPQDDDGPLGDRPDEID